MICSYIYFIKCGDYVKIGKTKHTIQSRIKTLEIGNPYDIEFLFALKVYETVKSDLWSRVCIYEHTIHEMCKSAHVKGEWFKESEVYDIITGQWWKLEVQMIQDDTFYGYRIITDLSDDDFNPIPIRECGGYADVFYKSRRIEVTP